MTLPHEVLEAGRIQADLSRDELWLAYFALGGSASRDAVYTYLDGRGGAMDYDVLAQAINERFVELGQNHPVPYFDEFDSPEG